jgi:23S rRNA pseudouridine1911/1915/1917 synthase
LSELQVLYRDAALAVVDKPAGLPVEADSQECAVALLSRQLAPKGGRAWPRVVHRLDRGTSGCLLIALNDRAARGLLELFEQGRVRKRYLALVAGEPPEQGALDTAYGKDPRDPRRYTTRVRSPKRARLSFRVRERLRGAALLEVELDTGRTHQIRVQLSEAGFPVLGDETYGAPAPLLQRPGLHAERLTLPHPAPAKGTDPLQIDCTAAVPADLAACIASLR